LWRRLGSETSAQVGRVAARFAISMVATVAIIVRRTGMDRLLGCHSGHVLRWSIQDYVCAKAKTASSTGSALAIEDEVNRDLCFHFHRFSIQIIGTVFPLPHRIVGCMRKHRMTADDFGPLNHS